MFNAVAVVAKARDVEASFAVAVQIYIGAILQKNCTQQDANSKNKL
jgi:hypothetical protein